MVYGMYSGVAILLCLFYHILHINENTHSTGVCH